MFFTFLSALAGQFLYLSLHLESSSFPRPLSPQQETEAFEALQQGDAAAREKLIRHNLRLVSHIAKKYYASSAEQEDLVSIGTIGLIKAVSTYKTDQKVKFSTYASRCIENEIKMHLRKGRREIQPLSMQDTLESGKDGSSLTIMDVIPDDFHMEDRLDLMEDRRLLHLHLAGLEERERQILTLRYGLDANPPLSQHQVAALLGISRSYVSRLEKKAIEQLKKSFLSQ